jgi:hypothetical protein
MIHDQSSRILNQSMHLPSFLVFFPIHPLLNAMLTFLAAAWLSVALVDAEGFRIGHTVKTTSGDITGQPSSWKPEVSEYISIPYAEPPVGKWIFSAPVAIKAAGKAVNATKYVRCFQVRIKGLSTRSNLLTGTVRDYQLYH